MSKDRTSDPVLLYLIAVNLADREIDYRGLLRTAGATGQPALRHFAIATVSFMLQLAQVPMPAIMTVITTLRDQTDEELKEGLIAILNGTHLVISKGSASNGMFLIGTMEPVDEQPRYLLTSNMYFVKHIWKQIEDVLAGRA